MVRVRGSIGVKLERGAGICVSAAHALPKHEMTPNDGESQPKTEGRRWALVSLGPRSELRGDFVAGRNAPDYIGPTMHGMSLQVQWKR